MATGTDCVDVQVTIADGQDAAKVVAAKAEAEAKEKAKAAAKVAKDARKKK